MRKEPKRSPTESPLLFEVDPQPIEETLTALGGIPLVVQAFRSLRRPSTRGPTRRRGIASLLRVREVIACGFDVSHWLTVYQRQ
jgi:hypothetical protein